MNNRRVVRRLRWLSLLAACAATAYAQPSGYSFEQAQVFLKSNCQTCHQGKTPAGNFDVQQVQAPSSLQSESERWNKLAARVANGEMPPKGAPAPAIEHREHFTQWVDSTLRAQACGTGLAAGPLPIRRLNRAEYSATIRDLFDIHLDIGRSLPEDGAGGEGFNNAAETLFLSPLHADKYMEVAKLAVDFAAKEYKSREKIFVAYPGKGVSADRAAREILTAFLPRAFRRTVSNPEVLTYLALYRGARRQGNDFEPAVLFALRAALVSPHFLFRVVPANPDSGPRPLHQFALASRLSYFLWNSMPDELLFDVAAAGKLHDPEVLRQLVRRMIRNDRAQEFARSFAEQWLRTGELSRDKAPDPELFPAYAKDEDLRSDIRLQPVLFLQEILVRNESLLNLLDSKYTVATRHLSRHFDVKLPLRQNASTQPQWVELPEGSDRGGLLGMPAILTVSSYPYRTSPVLRGAWILDAILGAPPPPPPPDVPELEKQTGTAPKSVRDLLTQHRANAVCASCHDRIDPLGFALENYDVIGRWRKEDGGKPVDNSGELADGTKFNGPVELKAALLARKDVFIRNLTKKMLGYALGRGLTVKDSCTVDAIVAELKDNDYKALTLIDGIVLSMPFRYQEGAVPLRPARKEQPKP